MAQYVQYAFVAAQEALQDAGWYPQAGHDQEMTVICTLNNMLFELTENPGRVHRLRHWQLRGCL